MSALYGSDSFSFAKNDVLSAASETEFAEFEL